MVKKQKMEQTNVNLTEEQLFAYKYPVGKFIQPEKITVGKLKTN